MFPSDLNHRLTQAREAVARRQRLRSRLDNVRRSLEIERKRLAGLETELEKAGREVSRLEGLSLAGLFYSILGSKEQQLEKERQEVLRARLKHTQSSYTVSSLEQEAGELERELAGLGDAETRYQALLSEKEAWLLQAQDERTWQLLRISDELAAAETENHELEEAIAEGSGAQQSLERVIEAMRSAGAWGTWDILGGGVLTNLAKHSRIDEAREAVLQVQQQLRRFQRELMDTGAASAEILVDINSFETFADFFFDGLISDWIVQSKIDHSLDNASKMHEKVGKILSGLAARQQSVQKKIRALQEEKQRLVESA